MIFVTGPACSGKQAVICRMLGLTPEQFSAAAVRDVQELAAGETDLEKLADRLAGKAVVIASEIGCGVVPESAEARAHREKAGRLACLLSERADTVVRVCCGLPQLLKGSLPEPPVCGSRYEDPVIACGTGPVNRGMVHLYWGDGKGKTTAAVGLAVRAVAAGRRVVFVQFLKDGSSDELASLRKLGIRVFSGSGPMKFVCRMTGDEKETLRSEQTELLQTALKEPCELLILDEACAAWQLGTVDRDLLRQAVLRRPPSREIVLTGRSPAGWMTAEADYSTEMRCQRHPYGSGIGARKGIEY